MNIHLDMNIFLFVMSRKEKVLNNDILRVCRLPVKRFI